MTWGLVALAGALGVSLRFGLVTLFAGIYTLPIATLAANTGGSLLIGAAYVWSTQAGTTGAPLVLAVTVGLLGGLTTFSSYSLETIRLMQSGYLGMALVNVLANNLLCLVACYIGMRVAGVIR